MKAPIYDRIWPLLQDRVTVSFFVYSRISTVVHSKKKKRFSVLGIIRLLSDWLLNVFCVQFPYRVLPANNGKQQNNIKQTIDENKEKYQLGDYQFMQYQILQNNMRRIIQQTVRRIAMEILGVKGLNINL